MATKNSTRSAKAPATINPFAPSGHPTDTVAAVREVLAFLSQATESMEGRIDSPDIGYHTGLSRILEACQFALASHSDRQQEGGAA